MDPIIQFAGLDDTRGGGGVGRGGGRGGGGRGRGGLQNESQQQRQRPQSANRGPGSAGQPAANGTTSVASAAAMAAMSGGSHGMHQQHQHQQHQPGAGSQLSWQQQMLLGQDQRGPKPQQARDRNAGGPPQPQQPQQQGQRPPARSAQPGGGPQQQVPGQGGAGGRPQSARGPQQGNQQQQGQQQAPQRGQKRPVSAQLQGPRGPAPAQQQFLQHEQRGPSQAAMPAPKPVNATALAHHSDVRFDSLAVSPLTKRAMAEVFGYEMCTKVQAQAIPVCLTGVDTLAKAKTGTGKTIGFMIPAIEKLLREPPRAGQVGALVLSPTRELAMQIHTETEKLLRFHKLKVQFVIGGTNINAEAKRLQNSPAHILVGTPGRCLDHLTNDSTHLDKMMQDLRVLVLDEADNILDMGFRPTIDKILAMLPNKSQRQTLLFSATFPHNVKELARFALRPAYSTVDTVGEEASTNQQVEQMSCVVPHHEIMMYLSVVIKTHMQQDPQFKVMVFFPTARLTQLYAETFQVMGFPVLEMHSRKSQAVRTRMSDEFRAGYGLVMFSSDVSARGVDYPDVSLVVQVGLPADRDQYIHRVGRTSRAGKAGQSLLLLADFEAGFLNKLQSLPIRTLGALSPATVQADGAALTAALAKVSADTKGKAYAAWLGFYKSAPGLSMSVGQLVDTANHFSRIIGCKEPPELEAKTIGKMGLKGVPGLRVQGRNPPPQQQQQQRR